MSISITHYSHVHQEWVLLTGKFPGWSVWKQKREWGQSTDSALHRWLGGSYWRPNNSPFHRQTLRSYGWGQSQIQQSDPRRLPEKETRVKFVYLEKTTHSFKKVIIIILYYPLRTNKWLTLTTRSSKQGENEIPALPGGCCSLWFWKIIPLLVLQLQDTTAYPDKNSSFLCVWLYKYIYMLKLVTFWWINITMPSVQFSRSVVSDSFRPRESQHARPPCLSSTPGVHPDPGTTSQCCHPAISSSVIPFSSCPQSLPASEYFPMSQLFTWGGQSTGVSASASFPPKKSQGWSPSEWPGWISLQS